MKYSELISFDPLESVIVLTDSKRESKARDHVSTYVISDQMADRLCDLVIPHLQYDRPHDNKGLLVVGNYGTGKSHLMSVISSVAADTSLAELLTNKNVRERAGEVAGKFQVIRQEIGGITMGLRNIVTGAIEDQFEEWGISYRFPPSDKIRENKSSMLEMMGKFEERFPGQGLLFVIDELLDYLRSRRDHELILDLGFLREIGEICKDSRFRFIAGVQEAIFDSGRFAHVADSIGRVKDRFLQVKIATTDLKFVVSNRILKKSDLQKEQIRNYLTPFAKCYSSMNERMEEFISLFPAHPDYVETFERIPIVEKRGVLVVLSDSIKRLLDTNLPEQYPGVVALDSFWKAIIENPANRADERVRSIMEVSTVLESKIKTGFTRKVYAPMAQRIVDALSVHRLTTGDLNASLGMTPEELRDGLCLYHPSAAELGGDPADDLLSVVETALREIHRTVSGQFISQNKDNRQVYLDLKKTDDYDALVEKRAEGIDDNELDRYYYEALKQVLEYTDVPTHVTGYHIWEHEVEWVEKKAGRRGYLFFGAPNERSTAVPSRDFYLYFVPPFDPPKFADEKRPDEVFFRLTGKDEAFGRALKLYAAAIALSSTSSGVKKQKYDGKALEHLSVITQWLREHLLSGMEITYQGSRKQLSQWPKGASGGSTMNLRDAMNTVGSRCLSGHFQNLAPDYPTFTTLVTFGRNGNSLQAAQEALRGISASSRSRQANAILDALELLDGEGLSPTSSRYASEVLAMLASKGTGQVVNRSELVAFVDGVEFFLPQRARLELEWGVVILAALVHSGDLVLAVPGQKYDATNLAQMASAGFETLGGFKHIERPKDWNTPALKALFELLDLPPGLAVQVTQGNDTAVQQLHEAIRLRVERLVVMRQQLSGGLPFWGHRIYSDPEIEQIGALMLKAKDFLEGLQSLNTPGKLKNLRYEASEITAHRSALQKLAEVVSLETFTKDLSVLTSYLSNAESSLHESHPWAAESKQTRTDILDQIQQPANRESQAFKDEVMRKLRKLKADYIQAYLKLYRRARLSLTEDREKSELLKDYRLDQLRRLVTLATLNRQQLTQWENQVASLKTGQAITEKDLENEPRASDGFWPAMEPDGGPAAARLQHLKAELGKVHRGWTDGLLNDLSDPVVQSHFDLLKPDQRKLLQDFIQSKELPDSLSPEFLVALQQVLSGLSRVPVTKDQMAARLFPDGQPSAPEEIRRRFEEYLDELLEGREPGKVRIVLE